MSEPRTLRDREFDSLLQFGPDEQSKYAAERAALDNSPWAIPPQEPDVAAQAAQSAPRTFEDSPFAHAAEAIRNSNQVTIDALTGQGDFQTAASTAKGALATLLDPYYLGNGQFANERFLRDLETTKGEPLEEHEVILFGRVVGKYVGAKLAAETVAKIADAAIRGASIGEISDILILALEAATA